MINTILLVISIIGLLVLIVLGILFIIEINKIFNRGISNETIEKILDRKPIFWIPPFN